MKLPHTIGIKPIFLIANVSAFIAASAVISGCSALGGSSTEAVVGEGWQLIWNDEFNSTTLDADKWGHETHCWGGGNNELQCYTDRPENSFIRDGKLIIHAQKETFTGPAEPVDWENTDPNVTKTLPYTSARLRTAKKAEFKYGRIEVRAKLPGDQGIWPAIWMLPTDYVYGNWAASGEIDIMEAINLGTTDQLAVYGTLHYGGVWPTNKSSGAPYVFENADPREEFHTYAIEWAANEIRWYVDDVHYATHRSTGWYSQITNSEGKLENLTNGEPFDQDFHILLNVAVGGNWPGNPDDTTQLPTEMEVEFVRVYECPDSPQSLITCATKNSRAKRIFGNAAPEIVTIEYDPDFINQDTVTIFADKVEGPFLLDNYTSSDQVLTSIAQDEGHGAVTRIQFNTDESIVYFQSKEGFDYSDFSAIEFDLKIISDPRESGDLMVRMDCFHPCTSGDYPIPSPEIGEWMHYRILLDDLVNHLGSALDLTNLNTPFVISPEWGNQRGVVLNLDNIQLVR